MENLRSLHVLLSSFHLVKRSKHVEGTHCLHQLVPYGILFLFISPVRDKRGPEVSELMVVRYPMRAVEYHDTDARWQAYPLSFLCEQVAHSRLSLLREPPIQFRSMRSGFIHACLVDDFEYDSQIHAIYISWKQTLS